MKWLAIVLLMLTSCTVNHYTCECKHQSQFMPGQYTVPGYKTFPSNTNLFKGERIGIGSCDTMVVYGKLGLSVTNPSCTLRVDEHHDYKFGYGPPTPTKPLDIKGIERERISMDSVGMIVTNPSHKLNINGTRLIIDTLNVIK